MSAHSDSTVLITGASSGIGLACARRFAQEGRALVLVARRRERLEALREELAGSARAVHVFTLDVTHRAEVEAFFKQEAKLLSDVDVLVNNAGLARGMAVMQDGLLDDWEAMIDTNVKGLLYFTRLALPAMLARGRGHIVNLGSVAGRWVYPKGNIYCATKHAVHAISQALRLDLLGKGIRVSEINPGMVETEFSEVRLGDKDKAKALYAGMTPLTADDIAECVQWCVGRPARIDIQELVIFSADQASPSVVHRQ